MSHILFINHTRELHGAEQVLLQSLQSAHEAGHRVTVVLPSHVPDSGLDAEVRKWADAILYLPYRPAGDSLLRTWLVRMYNSYAWCRLVNYIRREKVQVVYSNTIVTVVGVSREVKTLVQYHRASKYLSQDMNPGLAFSTMLDCLNHTSLI